MCGGGLLLAARQAGRTRDAVRHENTAGKGEQHGEREERREAAHRGPQTEGSEFVRASEHGGGRGWVDVRRRPRPRAQNCQSREKRDESDTRGRDGSRLAVCVWVFRAPSVRSERRYADLSGRCSGPWTAGPWRTSEANSQRLERIWDSEGLPALPATVTELRCGSPKRPKLVGTAKYYVAVQLRQHAIRSGRPDALRPDAGPLRRR